MNEFVFRQIKEINRFSFVDMFCLSQLNYYVCDRTYTLSNHVTMIIGNNQVTFFNDKTNSFGKAKIHKDDMKNRTPIGITIAIAWARYKGESVPPLTVPTTCKTENLKVGDIYYYHPQGTRYKVLAVYEDGFISHPVHLHNKPSFSFHSTVTVEREI